LAVAAALLAGLCVRALYWGELAETPGFHAPQNDPQAFLSQAEGLAWIEPLGPEAPYFKAPFYPYLLAALFRLGLDAGSWARIVQMALGLGSALVGAALARRLGGSPGAAVATAALLACTGIFVYFEGEILITAWIVFFDLAALLVLSRRGFGAPAAARSGAAGILLGISAIARPTVLIFAACVGLGLLVRGGGRGARAALFALGLGMAIAPVTLRNWVVGDDLVLISSQGGIAFYTGNNAASDGMFGSPAGFEIIGGNWEFFECVRRAEERCGRSLRPSEVSRFYLGEGLHFWLRSPRRAGELLLRKGLLFWGRARVSNNQDIDRALLELTGGKAIAPLFSPAWDAALIAVGLAGLVWLGRRGWLLSSFVVVYSATVVCYFVATRYRVPVLAALAPAAGIFLADAPRGPMRRLLFPVLVGALALGVLWPDWFDLRATSPAQALFARAESLQRLGRTAQAVETYSSVLSIDPDYPRARLNLGAIAMQRGEQGQAEAHFTAELRRNAGDPLALHNLGALRLEQRRPEAAIALIRQAIAEQPNYIRAHRSLARALSAQGRGSEALAVLDRALEICAVPVEYRPDEAGVRSDRAALLAAAGRLGEAEQEYRRALDLNPRRIEPRMGLGSVLGRLGRPREAESMLLQVLAQEPERLEAQVDLGNVLVALGRGPEAEARFRRAAELDPLRPEPWFALAHLALREGRVARARDLLEECLRRSPEFEPARRALDRLPGSQVPRP